MFIRENIAKEKVLYLDQNGEEIAAISKDGSSWCMNFRLPYCNGRVTMLRSRYEAILYAERMFTKQGYRVVPNKFRKLLA